MQSLIKTLPTDRYESQHLNAPLIKKVRALWSFEAEDIGELSLSGECLYYNIYIYIHTHTFLLPLSLFQVL